MEIRLKLFFAQLFLLISSESTEQSQICVMNTVLVKQERGDPCCEDNLTQCSSQQTCWSWHPHTRKSIAEAQGTSGTALTTRSSDKDLYGCMIPENSWSRTVLHDKGHWRVLTICRASDMSWVHFARRRNINWPERLDSRKHQNWVRVRESPATCKINMKWKLELNLYTKTILTCGSEFLMDWTSWSRIWSTTSTTTTSRRPLRRSRKNSRWKRKYLLLQAEQRLKSKKMSQTARLSAAHCKWGWSWASKTR